MSFDTYTQSIPLTQKAKFWSNYVSALKGSQDLYAGDCVDTRTWYPSITETVPEYPDLKKEFGKIEDQMLSRRRAATPLTPVLPNAHDRICSVGYSYEPIHADIYGTFQARTARIS
eukprot:TRINITY_DN937_c0_g1_i11.p2 TRINITY_DN937_c0_g1~~TRINITY_DN937_c0_g1_i11.p2  ORF type:complete len:116 (-),score=27.81 TRINITY_DN937_c0_g1_i11:39-386(-)